MRVSEALFREAEPRSLAGTVRPGHLTSVGKREVDPVAHLRELGDFWATPSSLSVRLPPCSRRMSSEIFIDP